MSLADPLVAVVMGSSSDLPVMQGAVDLLERFEWPTRSASSRPTGHPTA